MNHFFQNKINASGKTGGVYFYCANQRSPNNQHNQRLKNLSAISRILLPLHMCRSGHHLSGSCITAGILLPTLPDIPDFRE